MKDIHAEPFGVVVLEAMACGLPVVSIDGVGAAVDPVRDCENGYVVEYGDAPALHLLSPHTHRERNAGQHCESHYQSAGGDCHAVTCAIPGPGL